MKNGTTIWAPPPQQFVKTLRKHPSYTEGNFSNISNLSNLSVYFLPEDTKLKFVGGNLYHRVFKLNTEVPRLV